MSCVRLITGFGQLSNAQYISNPMIEICCPGFIGYRIQLQHLDANTAVDLKHS